MAQRETENNVYAKFWGDKESIMVCYGISGVVNGSWYLMVNNLFIYIL